jgi:hypothetical protein
MALVFKDRVKETTTTTGTITVVLAGAEDGFQAFSVIGDANTTYYTIVSGDNWEVGLGTYTLSGTTLSRDTVLESSNSGSKITLAGTSDVFCTYPAEKAVTLNGTVINDADVVATANIVDDNVTADKLANSINTEITANTAKVTNATHTGDVTGATSLTIANDAVVTAKILDSNVTDAKIAAMSSSKLTGALPAISGASLTALPTTTALLSDYSTFVNSTEKVTVAATAATGTINYDTNTQSVVYYTTAASGDWTVNFRASASASLDSVLATGEAITLVHLVTLTGSEYRNTTVQVDGVGITPEWQGGSAPTEGNANSIDSYTYTIIKTGSAAFTILAALTQFA